MPEHHPDQAPPQLTLDLQRYQPYFDDPDNTQEDKDALAEALWSIITSFVRMGWGVSAVDDALAEREVACGQIAESGGLSAERAVSMVEWRDEKLTGDFDSAAAQKPQKESAP